jgi:methylated-DNA-[protein]-cysteine S-methyltransferase
MADGRTGRLRYDVFPTSWGWCAAADRGRGVCAFVLPLATEAAAEQDVLARCPGARREPAVFKDLALAVGKYFDGWTVSFDIVSVDLSAGTAFQQRVWTLARRIAYGQVRSYRWIGLEMGRPEAARAIGAALGANPVPLLAPCHRVVAEDGTLCGFSGEGGLELKARMLTLEGARLMGEGARRRVAAR